MKCSDLATSHDLISPIVNQLLIFSYGSSNPGHYNFLDEGPGMIYLIKRVVVHSHLAIYPPNLSENEGLRLNILTRIDWTLVSVPCHMCNKINKHSPT